MEGSKMNEAIVAMLGERQAALRRARELEIELSRYGVRLTDTPQGTTWALQVQVPEEAAALEHG